MNVPNILCSKTSLTSNHRKASWFLGGELKEVGLVPPLWVRLHPMFQMRRGKYTLSKKLDTKYISSEKVYIIKQTLKVVYPLIFVSNIFPNSRLIQKYIHIWQLFWKMVISQNRSSYEFGVRSVWLNDYWRYVCKDN